MLILRTELANFTWSQENRTLTTEASAIGLGPGHWADEIEVWDRKTGREVLFNKKEPVVRNGEILYYIYGNASTIRLRVFND